MDGRRRNVAYDYGVSAQPVVVAAWRGRCSIPVRNIDVHLSAHLSNKARLKGSEVASMMPESLCLEIFPRLDVWPSIFKRSPPTESSIDLFLFSEERDEEAVDSLLIDAIHSDFALKAMIGEAELLIFHSLHLPEKLDRFQGKYYFWGLFREQKHAFSHESDCDVKIQNTGEKHGILLKSGNHMSFEGKEISKCNTTENNPGAGNLGNTKVQEVIRKHPGFKRRLHVREDSSEINISPKCLRSSSPSSSYDRNRFVNHEAAKQYAKTYCKKPIILERGIVGILDDTIAAHGWQALVSHPPEAVIPIVREFYANAKERKGSKVFVRGKWVPFDQNTINKFYNISQTSDEKYVGLCEGRVDPEEIIRAIAYPGTKWKHSRGDVVHFPFTGLLPENKAWHYLVSAKILPSNNLTEVTKKRAILNYAIHLRLPINVGRVIERNIEHILQGSTTAGLAYPSLITKLCLKAGVKFLDSEELRKPIDAISAATLARYKSHRIDRDVNVLDNEAGPIAPPPDKESSNDNEAGPSAPAPDNKSYDPPGMAMLQHQVSELRQSMDEMRAYFEYQVQFNTAMAATLSSILQGTTFPTPPPSFSHAPASFTPPSNSKKA